MLERFFSEYLVFTHVLTLSSTHVAGYRHIRSSGVPHIKEHVVSEHLGVPATTYQFCSDFLGVCQISPPKIRLDSALELQGCLPGGDGFERRGRGESC